MYHTHAHPFVGVILMIGIWVVQRLIAFLIFRDAKEQKMLAPVWTILAILPFFGFLVDIVYLIIRELGHHGKWKLPRLLCKSGMWGLKSPFFLIVTSSSFSF